MTYQVVIFDGESERQQFDARISRGRTIRTWLARVCQVWRWWVAEEIHSDYVDRRIRFGCAGSEMVLCWPRQKKRAKADPVVETMTEVAECLGLCVIRSAARPADLLATAASARGQRTALIVSDHPAALQFATDHIPRLHVLAGKIRKTPSSIFQDLGVWPSDIPAYLSLVGCRQERVKRKLAPAGARAALTARDRKVKPLRPVKGVPVGSSGWRRKTVAPDLARLRRLALGVGGADVLQPDLWSLAQCVARSSVFV
uniref:Uncharacterized protein n=1 Tax=viral metagenome TaxID=1070528 RepID=A0A6M3M1Q9_9ZZZZ